MKHAVFELPIGPVVLAWEGDGIAAVHLPDGDHVGTLRAFSKRCPESVATPAPAWVEKLAAQLSTSLSDGAALPSAIPLAIRFESGFLERVYDAARRIPRGETRTYGELAAAVGSPGAARAVGQAMARNPVPLLVPCHRVIAADGSMHGFSAAGGIASKRRLLELEGAPAVAQRTLFQGESTLSFDAPRAVRELSRVDDRLGELIARIGPFALKLDAMRSPFEALQSAIIHQQLAGAAARTIEGRFKGHFGNRHPSSAELLSSTDEQLRAIGLSRPKILAMRDLAANVDSGVVPPAATVASLTDEELVERLTAVRGVGVWTVQMMLIFRLGRPDVLPVADLGIQRGFARMFRRGRMPEPAQVERRGRKWAPWRSVASWYLWRASELPADDSVFRA